MLNTEEIIKRLERILEFYGLSAAAFADKIQVQRSSISHLLTGRNKPSLEFILKVTSTFPEVDLYWLLEGKGFFPSDHKNETLKSTLINNKNEVLTPTVKGGIILKKIILLYNDGSFESFDGDA